MVLESKNNWGYEQTQRFVKGMVEDHFKSKEVTPEASLQRDKKEVEHHFKSKGVTPEALFGSSGDEVEDHFKSKGVKSIKQL